MLHENEPPALECRAPRAVPSDKVISSAVGDHQLQPVKQGWAPPAGALLRLQRVKPELVQPVQKSSTVHLI